MGEPKWTDEQLEAINCEPEKNILVSAAAGSGKTAVLTARILRKLREGRTTLDRLLVVTFTEKAASEMREKIIRAIKDEIKSNPESAMLMRSQLELAQTAEITTIDAFCKRVVQNNFHALGIDAELDIAVDPLPKLMSEEAALNTFEKLYEEEDNENFLKLAEAFRSKSGGDDGLMNMITEFNGFIESFAEPERWLDDAAEMYPSDMTYDEFKELPIIKRVTAEKIEYLREFLTEAKHHRENVADRIENPKVRDFDIMLCEAIENMCGAKTWEQLNSIYKYYFTKPEKGTKGTTIYKMTSAADPEKPAVAVLHKSFKEAAKAFSVSLEEIYQKCDWAVIDEYSKLLVRLMKEFRREYAKIKDNRRMVEFSDIEHLAYRLFLENEEIREEYKNRYDEILIDEYQDTNGLQDSIFTLISRNNIFMVGDLKQSIYRFRGGDPYIFKSKGDTYLNDGEKGVKLMLSRNFRSRREVLRSVNTIFCAVMSDVAGDVDYRGKELIRREKELDYYPPAEGNEFNSELYLVKAPKKRKAETEIMFAADKIEELLKSDMGIECRDIAVLKSSVKNIGTALVEELERRNISSHCEIESFFEKREIVLMLDLISVLDNAAQNIPFVSVMRSPLGRFSDDDLARIAIISHGGTMYEKTERIGRQCLRVRRLQRTFEKDGVINIRRRSIKSYTQPVRFIRHCREFIQMIERFRGYVRTKSVAQLLLAIYNETYFYDIMGAVEQGDEAQMNLQLLYERAKQYESTGIRGLHNFIKYIERIKEKDEDIAGAKNSGNADNAVSIMTMHKSKGLEYKAVIILGTESPFLNRSRVPGLSVHKDFGFGMPMIYLDKRAKSSTFIKDYITEQVNREELSERMRLLYVALTRAKEKLITVSVYDDDEDNISEQADNAKKEIVADFEIDFKKTIKGLTINDSLSARKFGDWIRPVVLANKDDEQCCWDVKTAEYEVSEDGGVFCADFKEQTGEVHGKIDDMSPLTDEEKREIEEMLGFKYPYAAMGDIPSRTSVTQLKEKSMAVRYDDGEITDEELADFEPKSRADSGEENAPVTAIYQKPAFIRNEEDKNLLPNEIGTLYHAFMSMIDTEKIKSADEDAIIDEIDRIAQENGVSEFKMSFIDKKKIVNFFKSDIGKRMLASDEIRREEPFQIYIPVTEYNPDLADCGIYDGENMILQGIIDCFFKKEDGTYVLLDYKTDTLKTGSDEEIKRIKDRYKKQLELYSRAIERLTGVEVSESYLYLFSKNVCEHL